MKKVSNKNFSKACEYSIDEYYYVLPFLAEKTWRQFIGLRQNSNIALKINIKNTHTHECKDLNLKNDNNNNHYYKWFVCTRVSIQISKPQWTVTFVWTLLVSGTFIKLFKNKLGKIWIVNVIY